MIHKHEWHPREKFSGGNRKGDSYWIQGYVCLCGKVDYVNMSSRYKTPETKQGIEKFSGPDIIQ